MKRWALITVALYGLVLLALTVPVGLAFNPSDAPDFWTIFGQWGYWVWLGILISAQALLLLVPVDLSERRLPARRKLLVPLITAAFLLANLVFAGVFAIGSAFLGDHVSAILEGPANLAAETLRSFPPASAALQTIGINAGSDDLFIMGTALGMLAALWMIWGLIFFHFAQGDASEGLIRRITRWLLKASILELLVAVPSHIIVRQRNDCCAPFATFWGIVTGLSVMLLAFGPGVFFLFAKRMRKARPAGLKESA